MIEPVLRVEAPIETERLRLRSFTLNDLDGLAAIQSRSDVARFLYWDARDRQEVEPALAKLIAATTIDGDDDLIALAVERREDAALVGYLSIWLRSVEHRQVEIGFVFHPGAQGRGYATESSRELLVLAFERLGAHRVFGRTRRPQPCLGGADAAARHAPGGAHPRGRGIQGRVGRGTRLRAARGRVAWRISSHIGDFCANG